MSLLAAQREDRGIQVHVLLVPHQGHDLLGQELEGIDRHVVPELRFEGFFDLCPVVPDAHRVLRERADIGKDLIFYLPRPGLVAVVAEERESVLSGRGRSGS